MRKVEVESTDYAAREYGVTVEELDAFERAVENRYQKSRRAGRLVRKTAVGLRKMIEQTPGP